MSREQERLDRLMGLLASERVQASDLRATVMGRLRRSGAVGRRRRVMWVMASLAAIGVAGWVGMEAWFASARATDLGEIGRRGASWIVPEVPSQRAMPVRLAPKGRRLPTQAAAPWWRT